MENASLTRALKSNSAPRTRHLFGVGEITAEYADIGVHDLRLIILNRRFVDREVQACAVPRFAFEADFDVAHFFGINCRRVENWRTAGIGRQAAEIETNRFEARRVGCVHIEIVGAVVGDGDLAGEIGVVGFSRVGLRREN
jgi:hypothetical protein